MRLLTSKRISVSNSSENIERASSTFSFCNFSARTYSDIIIVSCEFKFQKHFKSFFLKKIAEICGKFKISSEFSMHIKAKKKLVIEVMIITYFGFFCYFCIILLFRIGFGVNSRNSIHCWFIFL